ncbi:copper chaperone PCu(A)C (plasmid) [Paraburkholderia sprentiae WSM5005]|uniref:Copper chaperone PCu(A)C n=2 Tax=Paraburkholderia sprentiae TaxID=948107 RepID=A0A1I9YUQ1_9BURK|nr:copper chaperone PCu(A)C [Paraburkholderia sprentiae WSM5005]
MASLTAFAAPSASVRVSDCWIRALPGDLPSGGYFKVVNMSDKPVDLTGVETNAFGMAMLHQTQSNGSTSAMVMVDKATVPANGTLTFAPGNYHVMLEQPKKPLKVGTSISLAFNFSDGEKVTAACMVKSPGTVAE